MTTKKKTAAPPARGAAAKNQAPDLEKIRHEIEAELRPVLEIEIRTEVETELKKESAAQVTEEVRKAVAQALEEIRQHRAHASEIFQADLDQADAVLAKDFPRYFDLARHLTQDQRSAVEYLEKQAGFEVFVESKVGEVTEKNGTRRRTFCKAGRYDIVLALPNVHAPAPKPEPAKQPDPESPPIQPAAADQGSLFDKNQALIDQMED